MNYLQNSRIVFSLRVLILLFFYIFIVSFSYVGTTLEHNSNQICNSQNSDTEKNSDCNMHCFLINASDFEPKNNLLKFTNFGVSFKHEYNFYILITYKIEPKFNSPPV